MELRTCSHARPAANMAKVLVKGFLPQAARPKTIARHRSSARSFLDFFIVIYLPFRKIAQFGPDDFVLPSLSVCPYYTLSLRKGQPPFYMIQKIFYRIVTDVTDLNRPL